MRSEKYWGCSNVGCCAFTTGSFCTIKEPVTHKPLLVENRTSLKNIAVSMPSPAMNRVEEASGITYFVFVDQVKGISCRNIGTLDPECNANN